MKMLLDFLPIVLFFGAFKLAGNDPEHAQALLAPLLSALSNATIKPEQIPILAATVVAIISTVAVIAFQKATRRPVEKMQWIGLGIIVVFGGATLVLQDETFIKWKPTVLYWAMGLGFVIANLFKRNPIQLMMQGQVSLPAPAWKTLLWAWITFFAVMGLLNIWVAYTFSTDIWVDFKLFGSLGATFAFVIGQGIYMSKHMQPEQTNSTSES